MCLNYLNAERITSDDGFTPFSESVVDKISKNSHGVARQFMVIAERLISAATRLNIEQIDDKNFELCLNEVKSEVTLQLTSHMRHLLYIAKQPGGVSEDVHDEVLDELNVKTYIELLPDLDNLVQQDLLIRMDDGKHIRYEPSKLLIPEDVTKYKIKSKEKGKDGITK